MNGLCRPIPVFVGFVVDLAFFVCLAGFLIMHIRLVAVNCTTIEMYEKRRVPLWPYDRGWHSNMREVFGARCFLRHLPMPIHIMLAWSVSLGEEALALSHHAPN